MTIDDDVINFKLRHCMVYFNHRKPTEEELETMTPVILTQGEVPWNPKATEHFTDKAGAFNCKVAEHICQVGNVDVTELIGEWLEDCVIDGNTSWEFVQASECPAALDFEDNPLKRVETNTPHLHKALPANSTMICFLSTSCTVLSKSLKRL